MTAYAKLITKHAKAIIIIWSAVFTFLAFYGIQLTSKLEGDGFKYDGDYKEVTERLSEDFGLPANTIFVVFEEQNDDAIRTTIEDIQTISGIQTVTSPFDNPQFYKEHISYAALDFDSTVEDFNPIIDELRDVIGDETIYLTGGPVIAKDTTEASQRDLIKAEAIGVPIAIIVLLLAFGTVVASILPVIVGAITVISTFGIMTLLSEKIELSIFILNIVPMLGLALSIDFALLFINRFREEQHKGSVEQAVQTSILTAGRSIIFSALCVMIGLGAMVVIDVQIFQNIALGGFVVVLLAVISGLTLLPAMLTMLGDRINKWRLIRVSTTRSRWGAFAHFVMNNPIKIIFAALLLLGLAMVPIKNIELTIPSTDALPTSYDARSSYDRLVEEFDFNKEASIFLLAEREDGWDSANGRQEMLDIQQQLQQDELVTNVLSMFTAANIEDAETWELASMDPSVAAQLNAVADNFIHENEMYFVVSIDADGSSTEAQGFIRDWMDVSFSDDVTVKYGGLPKFNQEIFDEITSKIGIALAIIIVTTFIILMIAFRSLLIPLKAIIMNVIGLGATFGILVVLFQDGILNDGTIALIIPVIVFCLVFGLSMDYEVFLISRIQEEYEKGATNTKATIDGLVSTSKIITSAALIMIVVTGAFIFTDVLPVKQIGAGIAIAVAIDATIIRLMLVPSLMKLFGDWNWWLPFKKKR